MIINGRNMVWKYKHLYLGPYLYIRPEFHPRPTEAVINKTTKVQVICREVDIYRHPQRLSPYARVVTKNDGFEQIMWRYYTLYTQSGMRVDWNTIPFAIIYHRGIQEYINDSWVGVNYR